MKNNKFIEKTLELSDYIDINLVKKFIVFDEISSTNSKAKELARNGKDEGTIVIARMQKKGRGRFDRVWQSPDGGLYLSIILRPKLTPDKTTLLPLVGALAVSKTINLFGLCSKIKWPNDVRINRRKTAGILLESESEEKQVHYVVLGIGINLNIDINRFSKELRNAVTSLSYELNGNVDYQKFLKILLSTFDKYYAMFINRDFDTILKEWKMQSDTLGKRIKIVTSSDEIIGKAYDVDKSGFLIALTESGEYKKIMSGDCIYFDEL